MKVLDSISISLADHHHLISLGTRPSTAGMTATNDLQSPLARLQADFARQHDHERQEAGSSSSSQPGVPSSSRPDALRRALQEDYNPFRASIDSTSTYGGPGWLDRRDSISSASVYSTSSAFTLTPSDPARRSEYFYHPSHDEERHLQVVQRRDSEGRRSLAGEVGVAHVFGQSKPTAPSSIAARPRRAAPPPPTIPEANGSSPRLAGSPRLAPARHPPGPSRQASESSFRSTASAAADGLPPGEHQLSLGIKSHQRGQLAESALHFRKSAEAGNTAGALLFGLSLRHGWGVVQDERQGLIYLERAVEASTARAPDGSIVVKPPVAGTPVRVSPKGHHHLRWYCADPFSSHW